MGRRSPVLLPVAALVVGANLALEARWPSVPAAGGLAVLGVALGGPGGRVASAFAAGLLGAWLRPESWRERPGFPDPERPVTVCATRAGSWRREDYGWSARFESERLRQGPRVGLWRRPLWVTMPGDAPPPAALRLRLTGYLKRSAGYANGGPVSRGPWRLRIKSRRFAEPLARPGPPSARLSSALRQRLGAAPSGARGAGPGLARALVLGEAWAVPIAVRRGLRRAGLAHLLAVSGLHVGLLAAAALLVGRRLPGAWRLAPVAVVAGLYLLVVGPRPAIVRASAMSLLAASALLLERPAAGPHTLALAVGGLVLTDPVAVRDLGFLLTATATAGIVGLAPRLARRWTLLPPALARPLAATVGAQLCSLPVALPAFHLLPLTAPLANLVAIPWTGVTLVLAFAWTGLAAFSEALARPLLAVLELAARPYAALAALPPGPFLALPLDLSQAAAGGLAAALAAALLWPRRVAPAVAALAVAGLLLAPRPRERPPELVMIDVGQGDALLLRDGPAAALVDGGGWRSGDFGGRVLLPALARLGVRRLQAVVLTHPDVDHCGGLADIAGYLPVGAVWTAPGGGRGRCARELLTLPGARLRTLWRGERAAVGRWRLTALHPAAGDRAAGNDRSLVLLASVADRRVLLTGDIEAAAERRLLATGALAEPVRILKVAHHGSRTSTGAAFLRAAAPRLALISAGRGNPYGHPSPVVLERLERRGTAVLRTDRSGLVHLRFPGDGSTRVELPGI